MVEDFLRMLLDFLAAVKPKCKLHLSMQRNVMIGHARHVPSLRSSSCGGILGYALVFYLGLGHFSVVEFWFMQGVSAAVLGHVALGHT